MPGDRAQRHVLGERHRMPLDVHLVQVRAGARLPDDAGVADLARARRRAAPRRPGSARRSRRPPRRSAARRRGCAAGRCRWSSPARPPGRAAAAGRPRRRRPAPSVRVDVVVQHRPALGVEVQARAGARCPARSPPCTAGAAGLGAPARSAGPASSTAAGRERSRPPRGRAAAGRPPAPPGQRDQQRRRRARHRERDQRRAAERGQPQQRATSPWLNASRPHGNPPNGARSRSASCGTQSSPVSSGHAHRHRSTSGDSHAAATPSSAR